MKRLLARLTVFVTALVLAGTSVRLLAADLLTPADADGKLVAMVG